jgi:hypothetical protein
VQVTPEERAELLVGAACDVSRHDNPGSLFCPECGHDAAAEIAAAIRAAVEEEREACAALADWRGMRGVAEDIRARK